MESILFKVCSPDATFLDFYSRLAHDLGGSGTVYTPYPVIPPNARMGVPAPTEILVALASADDFGTVYEAASVYLRDHAERQLTFESAAASVRLDALSLPAAATLADELSIASS